MEVEFERNVTGNYLVIECCENDYRTRMLESNHIFGLLDAEVKEMNDTRRIYYDISSKSSLKTFMETKSLEGESIIAIIECINIVLKNIEKYLLLPDNLVMDPEFIFLTEYEGRTEPKFSYNPSHRQDFYTGLSNLLREILGAVNQNDHNAVVLAYSLYQESLKENYVIGDLIRVIRESREEKRTDNPVPVKKAVEFISEPDPDPYKTAEDDYAEMFDSVNRGSASETTEQDKKSGKKKKLHLF